MVLWLSFFCIALRLSAAAYGIPGNETDRFALLSLKNQMSSYPPGSYMSSWNDSAHLCNWGGVTCGRRHQRVVTLNLFSQGLSGSISPYIGNLSFLRIVTFANNSLHGPIPQEIRRLTRLRGLYLQNNSLSGPVPVGLSHCINLKVLFLNYNRLSGKIPKELGACAKLSELRLQMNQLTGKIPASLGNLTSLLILDLQTNYLDGSIPSSLGQSKGLEVIALSENNLSGKVPRTLYNISSLEVFYLLQNQIEDYLPHDIGHNLPLLTQFSIAANKFMGPIPKSLFLNSSNIRILTLTANKFTGNVPVEVGRLNRLESLGLAYNFLGGKGKFHDDLDFVTSLNNCSNLSVLAISHNHFGGSLPASITNLSVKMESLYIGFNQITGRIPPDIDNLHSLILIFALSNFLTGSIPTRIGMLPHLQELDLGGNRLTGKIPSSIGNLTSLYFAELSYNRLSGSVVSSFENCQSLQRLYLNNNNLTGIVPKQLLGSLSQLLELDLSHNHFHGSLPLELGNLHNLYILNVSENKIVGEIPSTLGDCVVLEELHLQGNFLQGIIPTSFGRLKGIQFLDLSRNNLSGEIPKDLQGLPYSKILNLSFNNFDGEVPKRGVFRNKRQFSISGNNKLCGGIAELHLRNCVVKKSRHNGLPLVVKLTVGLVLPLIILASLLLVIYCWRNKSVATSKKILESNLQLVSYNELRDATNGFSLENLLGIGSFGSVYKGALRREGILVAVKVLNLIVRGASKSFMAECEILRRVRHRNLLKILTVCSSIDSRGNDFKALVYQFMSNGSLESWLHPSSDTSRKPSKCLNLLQRLNIVIDIASALDYLHNDSPTPITHCDLKPSNVLLDDDMVAYVGDFGLAKFLHNSSTSNPDNSQSSSIVVRGTIGYIPPEYGMGGEVTTEGDVYSFGIMLLEMFTGKRPTDEMFKDNLSLRSFCSSNTTDRLIEITDKHLLLEESRDGSVSDEIEEKKSLTNTMKECLISVLEVGVASSSELASERMGIKDVLSKMHKLRDAFLSN